MYHYAFSFVLCITLLNYCFTSYAQVLNFSETPLYEVKSSPTLFYTVLKMEYAKSGISNGKDWTKDHREKIVQKVDLVYTKYPKDKKDWITPYDSLLHRRIREVRRLVPEITDTTQWNIILQTNCTDEDSAKKMFHGAVVYFEVKLTPVMRQSINNMRDIIMGKVGFTDSTVYKVLKRNIDWKDVLLVNDWTGSMYPYGAQAVLWHRINFKKNAIKHFVFFNDGNMKADDEKEIGNTGGIFYAPAQQISQLVQVMREVMISGNGGDTEENDIEAILYGINRFNDYKDIILLADNKSNVRDISLLPAIKQPIHIILCGVNDSTPVNTQYLEIAKQTGGTLHTIDEDIVRLGEMKEGEKISIGGRVYILQDGKIVLFKQD
jgi:hypothetical protein